MDKIAYAVHNYLGLSETFIYEPLRHIKAFQPFVLAVTKENLDKFPYPRIYSVSDLPLHQRALEFLTKSFFKKVIRDEKPKLIHAHFGWEGIHMLPLKRYSNLPMVTSLYGADISMYPRSPVYRMQLKKLFREGDLFLAACEDLKKRAIELGCPENKILVQYCGIDLERFQFIPPHTKRGEITTILMLGRLVEKKGFDYGIKAFAKSFKNHKNIRLRIIGSGPQKNSLADLIESLGLGSVVNLEEGKNHQEVARAMQEADIFMMTYITARSGNAEGTPSVIKEAQAVGLPVITTKHAGVPEGVLEGETGFLAEEKDVEEISKKLNQLIENRDLRIQFGERGRNFVREKFNLINQVRELEDIYRKLC
jgi:glycosyltransferase involved in cell wall biosynthesis